MVLSWGLARYALTVPRGVNESVGAILREHPDALEQVSVCLHLIDMVRGLSETTGFGPRSRNAAKLHPYNAKHRAEDWSRSQGGIDYVSTHAWFVAAMHAGEISPQGRYLWRIPTWLEDLLSGCRKGVWTPQGTLRLVWTPAEAAR